MREQMPNIEYHRGEICPLKYMLCQEGYCAECGVYRSTLKKQGLIELAKPMMMSEMAQPVLNVV